LFAFPEAGIRQEDATMTTRLEAFVEQVASRQRVGVAEMVAH
jgi:hypothetical protein